MRGKDDRHGVDRVPWARTRVGLGDVVPRPAVTSGRFRSAGRTAVSLRVAGGALVNATIATGRGTAAIVEIVADLFDFGQVGLHVSSVG